MNKYLVTYTDQGDTCDGLARTLGSFDNKEDAIKEMQSDVAYYLNVNDMYQITECDENHTLAGDEDGGCLWQILEV
jgi:hypothetical protein